MRPERRRNEETVVAMRTDTDIHGASAKTEILTLNERDRELQKYESFDMTLGKKYCCDVAFLNELVVYVYMYISL